MKKVEEIIDKLSKDNPRRTYSSESSGLILEQYGNYMSIENVRSEEEHKKFVQELKGWAGNYHKENEKLVTELEEILSQFNTFDIIAHVSLNNMFIIPDEYEEPSHEGLSPYVEFVALLALKKSFSEGQKLGPRFEETQRIQELVEQIFSMHFWHTIAQSIEEEPKSHPSPLETLQFSIRQNELIVRGDSYRIHLLEVLRGLFSPFEGDLLKHGNFSVSTLLELNEAINTLVSRRIYERKKLAREEFSQLYKKIKARKRDEDVEVGLSEKQISELIKLPNRKIRQFLDQISASWVAHGIGQTTSFTADELAGQNGTEVDRMEALLQFLSAEFGSVEEDFCNPKPDHILKNKPLLHHKGRYLCPTMYLLNGSLLPTTERLLTSKKTKLAERYRKHRHDFLLQTAVERLVRVMPAATFDMNLYYQFEGERLELDALIQYDSVIFLIEAKGAPLTPPARRGAPNRLKRDLKKIIAKAHEQGHRAFRFLKEGTGRFVKKEGTPIEIELNHFKEVFVISLHLESLGHLTSLSHAVDLLGITSKEDEQSWMVGLYDLMILADIIEIPSMLPHYIKRRLRVAKQGFVNAHDELDLFCYYLQEGLFFDDESDLGGAEFFAILSHTVPLDDYYFYLQGERNKPAEKPKQNMRLDFERLINSIESSQLPFRTSVNMALLDQGSEARKSFCKQIKKSRKRFARGGGSQASSFLFKREGGRGITFMCGSENKIENLRQYCLKQREEMDYKEWYGILDCGRRSPKIGGLVCL